MSVEDRLSQIEKANHEQNKEIAQHGERLARIEANLEHLVESVKRLEKNMEELGQQLRRIDRRTYVLSTLFSGGIIAVWEFIRRKIQI